MIRKLTIIILLLISFLFFLDIFISKPGTQDLCNEIGIGYSKYLLSRKYDLYYDDSSDTYYMENPCEENSQYNIYFSRNILIPRVSKILVTYETDLTVKEINNKLSLYAFNDSIKTKAKPIKLYTRNGKIKFSLGRDYYNLNIIPLSISILK